MDRELMKELLDVKKEVVGLRRRVDVLLGLFVGVLVVFLGKELASFMQPRILNSQ